jgi:hypothetical protein
MNVQVQEQENTSCTAVKSKFNVSLTANEFEHQTQEMDKI